MQQLPVLKLRTSTYAALLESVRITLKRVGIAVGCSALLFLLLLYMLGGVDLLRFALSQLTWELSFKILRVIALVTLFTWINHMVWYRDEPPPTWLGNRFA